MIRNNSLSQVTVKGNLLLPNVLDPTGTADYAWGGAGLNDSSKGLRIQLWVFTLFNDTVYVEAPSAPRTALFTKPDITEIAGAFDQNMTPFVAFVAGGQASFWWYDTVSASMQFSDLPAGSISPRCTLDDNRANETSTSDIILAYVRNNSLYYRQQRDRYTVEYLLRAGVNAKIVKVAMNVFYRLQFKMQVI